ncbi:MAG: 3-oxoacyl-ACP reductase FabG [Cardiobacteriaceae bacterium]|nr:3-oxoacyl-ACP reductase FabG [Cardiobacteriaceae bacterium]
MNISEQTVVLITGASRGIGRGVLAAFGKIGATVIGTATSANGAESINSFIKENAFKGAGKVLDVNNEEAVNQLIEEIKKEFGAVGVLVNNAGITDDNLLMKMKAESWDKVISTNLGGAFRLSKAVCRDMMKARTGSIINISSVVGVMGNAGQANYSASKAGLIGFTKSLARELGSRGISVNAIAPGFIKTDMTEQMTEEQKNKLTSAVALGTLGEVADIADACVFLARANYITGETLNINGGLYML